MCRVLQDPQNTSPALMLEGQSVGSKYSSKDKNENKSQILLTELTLQFVCSLPGSLCQHQWPSHTTLGTSQNLLSQSTQLKG